MYKIMKPTYSQLEEQLKIAVERVNVLESALFGGRSEKADLTKEVLGNNVVHVIIGKTKNGEEIVGIHLDETDCNNMAANAREVYDEARIEPWLVQITPERISDASLAGRSFTYYHGQRIIYHDSIEGTDGTATVLSADYEYQKSPEEILYKVVPEGFPFVEQYAKILTGLEIRGFAK
ncbi:hypothetical protein [Citrobacter sp.]|uniref:hypothetical protein n=1 Tax=Citrobacter sp. TaxID=1896336 RepID=UPI002FC99C24